MPQKMAQAIPKEYREHFYSVRRELMRTPTDSINATQLRQLIAFYDRQIRDLKWQNKPEPKIGAGPTLNLDAKQRQRMLKSNSAEDLLTTVQAAELLGVNPGTLEIRRITGRRGLRTCGSEGAFITAAWI